MLAGEQNYRPQQAYTEQTWVMRPIRAESKGANGDGEKRGAQGNAPGAGNP